MLFVRHDADKLNFEQIVETGKHFEDVFAGAGFVPMVDLNEKVCASFFLHDFHCQDIKAIAGKL
ncbi:hypothetical protein [Solidesulfovibrio fructosivorans]|uniref:hypothetical protein n=1 Tax=Solidesulfovibrio fructosivorans TaxID=878 RepID=UPI003018568F